jgi:transposase
VHYEHIVSTRGDRDLRKLLVHGARATRRWVDTRSDERSRWLRALLARRGTNRAAVALANKNARIVWALLAYNQAYRVKTVG